MSPPRRTLDLSKPTDLIADVAARSPYRKVVTGHLPSFASSILDKTTFWPNQIADHAAGRATHRGTNPTCGRAAHHPADECTYSCTSRYLSNVLRSLSGMAAQPDKNIATSTITSPLSSGPPPTLFLHRGGKRRQPIAKKPDFFSDIPRLPISPGRYNSPCHSRSHFCEFKRRFPKCSTRGAPSARAHRVNWASRPEVNLASSLPLNEGSICDTRQQFALD